MNEKDYDDICEYFDEGASKYLEKVKREYYKSGKIIRIEYGTYSILTDKVTINRTTRLVLTGIDIHKYYFPM